MKDQKRYNVKHFFFSSRRRHTRSKRDWSSDVCSSDLTFSQRITSAIKSDVVCADTKIGTPFLAAKSMNLCPGSRFLLKIIHGISCSTKRSNVKYFSSSLKLSK